MAIDLQTDRLTATIAAVRTGLGQSPEPTIATFAADSVLVEGYRVDVKIRDFNLVVDEPTSIGGGDAGPSPVELVLAALGTCQEIVYATYARVLGIPLDGVRVRTEGRIDLRGFFGVADVSAGFQDVTFAVDIDSPATPEEIERLVAAVNDHCPVLEILRQPVPVVGSYRHNGHDVALAAD